MVSHLSMFGSLLQSSQKRYFLSLFVVIKYPGVLSGKIQDRLPGIQFVRYRAAVCELNSGFWWEHVAVLL